VNQTSLRRRLLASAAGLALGAVGTFSFAAPASAQDDAEGDAQTFGQRYEIEKVEVTGEAECDLETETWTVSWTITNLKRKQATVSKLTSGDEAVEVDGVPLGQVLPAEDSITGTQTFPSGTETAELTAELKWAWKDWWGNWKQKFASATATVELGECKEDVPPEEPPEEPEPPALSDAVFFGCDLFVVAIRNDGEEDEVTLLLTPNEDVESGHAPALIDQIDAPEGEFEAPEDFALEDVSTLAAGETFTVGPLGVGGAHAHGFEPFEGLVVTATVLIGEEEVATADLSWEALLAENDIVCEEEDDGAGGELPTTGSSTMLIAGGAVALLAVGGGLFLVARRRRVTFTA
jgi:LPXTG-motif cell wall-anchored protein